MTVVLDASAVLALLFDEPGADAVAEHVASGAVVSTVNLAEVATVLLRRGRDPEAVLPALRTQVDVVPFTEDDAATVAALYPLVSHRGLSLGDRACLALARRLRVAAITAEHVWRGLDVEGVMIEHVRPAVNATATAGHHDGEGRDLHEEER